MTRRAKLTGLLAAVTLLGGAGPALGAAGDLDPTFGIGGKAQIDLGGSEAALGMALRPDGRIVLGGYSGESGFVAQLQAQGSLDTTFGGGTGWTTLDPGHASIIYGVAVQADGRVVAVGSTGTIATGINALVGRIRADGTPDPDFAAGAGFSRLAYGARDSLSGLALQPDGAIIASGNSSSPQTADAGIVRVRNPQGDLDPGFAEGGGVLIPDLGDALTTADAVALQPDGRIVIAGARTVAGNTDLLVARATSAGLEDPSFGGGDGWTSIDLGVRETGYAVAIAPDGRIVVAGERIDGDVVDDTLVARFLPDGTPDPSFAGDGSATFDLAPFDSASHVALQPDGRIVIAATTTGATPVTSDMTVLRLRADGTLDPSFGAGGRTTIDFGGGDIAFTLALRPDGRIVIAGERDPGSGPSDIGVAQLLGDPASAGPGVTSARRAVCAGKRATIVGTSGRDRLRGTAKADVIAGLGGNDVINGLGGNDVVCAGAGKDKVNGGAGADRLIGGAGADLLTGGAGADEVEGGAGADKLLGGAGRDRLLGGAGADKLVGGGGVDALLGGAGRNVRTQ